MQKKFSYLLKIDELNQNEHKFLLNADSDECADIKNILQVEDVEKFSAEIKVKLNIREHILKVWGKVEAVLKLKSVISLEDFIKEYNIPFELIFDTKATYQDIKELNAGINDDVPDIIENGAINLADLAIEQVALHLDDYPRAEGETFDFSEYAAEPSENEKENPFAILKVLKK